MCDFKNYLRNELDKDRTLAKRLASAAGYKNTTPLYKYLNDEGREFDCLSRLIGIVESIYPEGEKMILSEYAKHVDPANKISRHLLDYFSLYLMSEERVALTERMIKCNNAESRQWAELYNIRHNISDYEEKLNVLDSFSTKSVELTCLKRIMIISSYFNIEDITVIKWMYPKNKKDILENIKSEYLKNSYLIRLFRAMASILLMIDNKSECSYVCEYVLRNEKLDDYSRAIINHTLGISCLFTDYDKGIKHLNIASNLYDKCGVLDNGDVQNSIRLHEIFWKRERANVTFEDDSVSTKHNLIYYLHYCGKDTQAKKLLNEIGKTDIDRNDLPYQYLNEGLLYNNINKFFDSIKMFKAVNQRFHMNLPLLELKSRGFACELLEAMKA